MMTVVTYKDSEIVDKIKEMNKGGLLITKLIPSEGIYGNDCQN